MIRSLSNQTVPVSALLVLFLAGCGGSMGAPLAQSQGDSSSVATPTITCNVKRYYHFGGACTSGPLLHGGTKYELADYRGVRASFKLPPYGGSETYTFTFADATGKDDIGKFHRQKFPLYPNPCGDSSCPGTAFVYVGLRISGRGALLLGPSIFSYRKPSGYPGESCGEAELLHGKWYTFGSSGAPKGDRLAFDSAIAYKMGATSIAVYCY